MSWKDIRITDVPSIRESRAHLFNAEGVMTLGEVDARSDTELLRFPGVGEGSVKEIREVIAASKASDANHDHEEEPNGGDLLNTGGWHNHEPTPAQMAVTRRYTALDSAITYLVGTHNVLSEDPVKVAQRFYDFVSGPNDMAILGGTGGGVGGYAGTDVVWTEPAQALPATMVTETVAEPPVPPPIMDGAEPHIDDDFPF